MPKPSSTQKTQTEITSLKSRVRKLQDGVNLKNIRDSLEDIQTMVNSFPDRIKEIRINGYAFEKNLESQANNRSNQFKQMLPNIQKQIDLHSSNLSSTLRPIEVQVSRLSVTPSNLSATQMNLKKLDASANSLENKVKSAERTISGMFFKLKSAINEVEEHLIDLEWMLKQIAEAQFSLLPMESGIMAVKAVWNKTGQEEKSDPEGVLYITDQRLLFEQKEKVATKKILFIPTEKKKVQNLLLNIPITLAEKVTTSKQGVFKNEDHIDIEFGNGAQVRKAHFHLWQDCTNWQSYINRARSNEFDNDRATRVDEGELKKVRSAPTICPNCGGKLDQVVYRGMENIKCDYCGVLIRL
ncbi:hypothetical protein ACFLTX_01245 [Chloroflexota bacterium]